MLTFAERRITMAKLKKPDKKIAKYTKLSMMSIDLLGVYGECTGTYFHCTGDFVNCPGNFTRC